MESWLLLDMDVDAVFGLIPPEDALHSEAEHIQATSECMDIDEGMNMTFQAYSHVPKGFTGNGTATLELTEYPKPPTEFFNFDNIDYTAVIQNPIAEDEPSAIAVAFENTLVFLLEWNGLVMTHIVVAVDLYSPTKPSCS